MSGFDSRGERILVFYVYDCINKNSKQWYKKILLHKSVSVVAIVTIIAGITAANAHALRTVGFVTVLVVILHNVTGLALGYGAASLLGFDKSVRKTIVFINTKQ
ncbi:MAG: hypothetical protein QHH74_04080 [Spirochaetota bacterium]|nr:hypothetical protein [Spirochaetota bacterium]